jgi:hypothetical protein
MKDGLAGARADVHDDLVILETAFSGGVRDELEHALRLFALELVYVPEVSTWRSGRTRR